METIVMDEFISSDMSYSDGTEYAGDMEYMDGMSGETQQSVADMLLSSPVALGGIAVGVLALGILFGFLSAKRKIKKGIDLYED
ncbi:MAG: hypothetical protein IKT67_09975 [Lachnospiraceae bacterium]|nr:hypothetical protein [Lachnospiraceae bacterium]